MILPFIPNLPLHMRKAAYLISHPYRIVKTEPNRIFYGHLRPVD